MNLEKSKIFVIIIHLLLILSCVKEVVIEIPEEAQQLVVNSFLSPEKNIEMHISESVYIYDSYERIMDNATVKIYENDIFIGNLTYSNIGIDSGKYSMPYKPLPNTKYSIEVSTDKYNISSSDFVPVPANVYGTERIENTIIDEYQFFFSQVRINIKDNPNVKNYYELTIKFKNNYYSEVYHSNEDSSWTTMEKKERRAFIKSENPIIQTGVMISNKFIFNDELMSGENTSFIVYYHKDISGDMETNPDYSLFIHLKTVSENYYKYQIKKHQYYQNQTFLAELNLGEPVPLYGNIENGYGIFAGYSSSYDTIPAQ